jgi:hypothetical protein
MIKARARQIASGNILSEQTALINPGQKLSIPRRFTFAYPASILPSCLGQAALPFEEGAEVDQVHLATPVVR